MGVGINHLNALYANTVDPWNFRNSTYERNKFEATVKALSRSRYSAIFELGCGNGELARRLVAVTDRYIGMDAIEKALDAARQSVPDGKFLSGFYPCKLPETRFELLVLSEILYFLDQPTIEQLASDIIFNWPDAEVICVTWLGPTGHELQGNDAGELFEKSLSTHSFTNIISTGKFRIDRALPEGRL